MLVLQQNAEHPTSASIRSRRGATMMEYVLILSLIGVACMVGIGYFGSQTSSLTQNASSAISKSLSPGNSTTSTGGFGTIGPDEEDKDGTKDGTKDKSKTK